MRTRRTPWRLVLIVVTVGLLGPGPAAAEMLLNGFQPSESGPVCNANGAGISPVLVSLVLAGSPAGALALTLLTGVQPSAVPLVPLEVDPGDGPESEVGLAGRLTDQQEALLGCGRFWGRSCDVTGIDLRNAEMSVLLSSSLWGSRGPGEVPRQATSGEMAALSHNFQQLLVSLSAAFDPAQPFESDRCSFAAPHLCLPFFTFTTNSFGSGISIISQVPGASDTPPSAPRCSSGTPQFCSSVSEFLAARCVAPNAGGNGSFERRSFWSSPIAKGCLPPPSGLARLSSKGSKGAKGRHVVSKGIPGMGDHRLAHHCPPR